MSCCRNPNPLPYLKDPNSFANNNKARVNHFHLNLTADFSQNVLQGYVELSVEILEDGVKEVVLDTKTLTVFKCVEAKTQQKLAFELDASREHPAFGLPLSIELPQNAQTKGSVAQIQVHYRTSPDCSAIQWLSPEQTSGKQHPYLFTQCQAIHCRSMMPVQDAPGVKSTYTGSITVPAPLVALMSAVSTDNKASEDGKSITYNFEQKVPMPSYLVALAVGALEKRDLGERCAVWSEKETVEAAAFEFAETEKFLQTAESICGPYVWGRYDLLLLPPSFPYGGMENPCLTFVTPTLLAGDRSLCTVVIHEIVHSWMGNLVTSQTWEHFWLNEGFTVYVERLCVRKLYGEPAAHLHAVIGWEALAGSVDLFGSDHPYTCLQVNQDGVDPDDSFSSVPYEKGFNFLFYLQGVVGGPDVMADYMKAHCKRFEYSYVNTQDWKDFFLSYFADKVDAKALEQIDWNAWLHKPGMPPVTPNFDKSLVNAAHKLAEDLVASEGKLASPVDIKDWQSNQIVVCLEKMQHLQADAYQAAEGKVEEAQARFATILSNVDETYHFSQTKNSEVRHRWITLCIRANMPQVVDNAVAFLKEQGRMKFVRPTYRELFKSKVGREAAISTFKQFGFIYHSIARKMVGKDLGL